MLDAGCDLEGAGVIELSELIGDLRDELTKAVSKANQKGCGSSSALSLFSQP